MDGPDIFILELYKALKQPGCPICNIRKIAEDRYIRFFLREYVNDVTTRTKLYYSWGFCNQHAWQIRQMEQDEYNDGLKTAILYHWMLDRVIGSIKNVMVELKKAPEKSTFGFKTKPVSLSAEFQKSQDCPVCAAAKESQSFHLENLVLNLEKSDFVSLYRNSDGLCLQHFVQALDLPVDKAYLKILCELQISRLEKIADMIDSYREKHNYQNQIPYTADELIACEKAILLIAGNHST